MQGQRFQTSKPAPAPKGRAGGWRGSQASLDALARHRGTWADNAHCRCGRVALAGCKGCYKHCGKLRSRAPSTNPDTLARREVWRLVNSGVVPQALLDLDLFRQCRIGTRRRSPYALALIHAWADRMANPMGWADACRVARMVLAA